MPRFLKKTFLSDFPPLFILLNSMTSSLCSWSTSSNSKFPSCLFLKKTVGNGYLLKPCVCGQGWRQGWPGFSLCPPIHTQVVWQSKLRTLDGSQTFFVLWSSKLNNHRPSEGSSQLRYSFREGWWPDRRRNRRT